MGAPNLKNWKPLFDQKSLPRPDRQARTVCGYAAMWTVDLIGDRIVRGAFGKTIKERGPGSKRCQIQFGYNHPGMTHDGKVVGVLTALVEDEVGLYYEGRLDETTAGEDALIRLESGSLNTSSFAFDILDYDKGEGGDDGERILKELRLHELGPVDFACNPDTYFTAIKSLGHNCSPQQLRQMPDAQLHKSFDPEDLVSLTEHIKAGRMFSAANLRIINAAHEATKAASERLADLLKMAGELEADSAPPEPQPPDDEKALAGTTEGTEILNEIRSLSRLLKGTHQ